MIWLIAVEIYTDEEPWPTQIIALSLKEFGKHFLNYQESTSEKIINNQILHSIMTSQMKSQCSHGQ